MAKTQFAFCCVGQDNADAIFFGGATVEEIAPTGTSAATTAASTPSQGFCRVVTDTAVYVTFGSAPTATSANGIWMTANSSAIFRIPSGSKAAVKV